jgi:hypothetical protein
METTSESTSIWTLKKKPLPDIAAYIINNGNVRLQAEMAKMPVQEYQSLSMEAAAEQLIRSISRMDDERYNDYLLDLIDE